MDAEKTGLKGWVEFKDRRTGKMRQYEIGAQALSFGGAILLQNGGMFLIRSTPKNGEKSEELRLNGRSVTEATLTNLDLIEIGAASLLFRAAYAPRIETITQLSRPAPTRNLNPLKYAAAIVFLFMSTIVASPNASLPVLAAFVLGGLVFGAHASLAFSKDQDSAVRALPSTLLYTALTYSALITIGARALELPGLALAFLCAIVTPILLTLLSGQET